MSNKFFKDLKKSLEEVVAYKEGKFDLYSEYIEIPEPPAEYRAKEIKRIRETNHYSQGKYCKQQAIRTFCIKNNNNKI